MFICLHYDFSYFKKRKSPENRYKPENALFNRLRLWGRMTDLRHEHGVPS